MSNSSNAQFTLDTEAILPENNENTCSQETKVETTNIVEDDALFSNEANKEQENNSLFQAIATLYGKIKKDEQLGYCIKIAGRKYRLFISPIKYRGWLKQIEHYADKPLYLRVYPKYQIIPRKRPEIYFQVVAWGEENQWSEPDIYIFRGIWQFIPQIKIPVVSIYRNRGSKDYAQKYKASHFPILMRREDEAKPFRFNPKIAKEQLPPRWFIQAKFKLIGSKNCWGWMEDLETPSLEIPGYKKPRKEKEKEESKSKNSDKLDNQAKVEKEAHNSST